MSLHTQRDLCKAWEKRFRSFLIQRGPGQVGLARSCFMNCLKWLIQVKVIFTDWVVGTTIIEVQTGRVLDSTFKIILRYLWRLKHAPTWKHDRNFCKRLVGEPRDRNCFTFWIFVVRYWYVWMLTVLWHQHSASLCCFLILFVWGGDALLICHGALLIHISSPITRGLNNILELKKLKLHTFFNPYRAWMVFNISQWWIGRSFAVSSQPRSRFKWIRPPDLLLATLWGLSCFLGGWVISEEVQSSLCSSTAESEYEHQMWWLRKVSSEYDCCFVTVHRRVLRGVRTVVTHHRFHFLFALAQE